MKGSYIFTSESVTSGHPDKMCDIISDSILDAIYEKDPNARVACEIAVKNNEIFVFGEITSDSFVDFEKIVRETIKEIGYDKKEYGFDSESCKILIRFSKQSPEIAQGVTENPNEQGAGDQGMMFGYACNETPELMPLPIMLAHKLVNKLEDARKTNLSYLRPDGKSQVSVQYENGKPKKVVDIVIAAQHDENCDIEKLRKDILENVINPICEKWVDKDTKYHINGTGKFVIGGPVADSGLTGRKIIVDTYGGMGRHGGGCFSGKDPSKIDRSGAYLARYIAKNIVASGLAEKCEVQLAYCIGVAKPTSIFVNTFGTGKILDEELTEKIKKIFPLKPAEIIRHLNLKKPIYKKTASYGHFGRNIFSWEKTDLVKTLLKAQNP